ncbi:hypothetical protein D3C78_1552770 [compost metagenome]
MAVPTSIEKMINASMLWRVNNCEKSVVVNNTVTCSPIPATLVEALSGMESLKLSLIGKKPTTTNIKNAETNVVNKKTKNIERITLPNEPICSILATDEEMAKKIRGIIAVKSKFRNISPMGFIMAISFPAINPAILPTKIPTNKRMILL